jgi:hypothetical protein
MDFKYEYTRLLVSDFKTCFLFYRDVMGFKPTYGTEVDTYADFSLGSVTLALFDRHEMSEAVGYFRASCRLCRPGPGLPGLRGRERRCSLPRAAGESCAPVDRAGRPSGLGHPHGSLS